jgi:hypothetical protein
MIISSLQIQNERHENVQLLYVHPNMSKGIGTYSMKNT